ncbi:bifunctional D-glycero-beta-D-manno-heptose-7-phosphate kinase/D-glycero-beta-D-manno-heptose 1-phosphate adenylyltransferase HldE [Candidatus Profftia sp. (ex Adelges kitamiensis)]|uniref:bifunctional D-glycero-beta-D-manno-heptose-7-phosphate kinase/D-glycero-beta-D-manno-heptose 1-phosphate adenylyltransferase HldE n=1 Tax=Candidatus Profftia sp. (ex Adelges kitamiensis) TaxID=2864218 RepID=UPI001CE2D137|nr:bifunctional D-glycero-beta-D-manno-heptose-7-phosphate kinase/D-glycero-beta-D-manno-heptose 1-phosphate adenylyltransferase HldE [Candidatus Profftia sp. (ex Adelges kitamiensis)]
MKITLPDFRNTTILVVGDVMLDRYWYGPTKHISPEAPVPIVNVYTIEDRPGGAANVAMNIASLGANTHLIGLSGIDNAARVLREKLGTANIKYNFVSLPTHPTIIKLRVLSRNQQLIRIDFEESFSNIDPKHIFKKIQCILPKLDALILSDYAKGTLNSIQNIIHSARIAKVPVLIDPKGINFERYRGATILTPNIFEFETIVGHCRNDIELVSRGLQLMRKLELTALLITRSEQGMTLLQHKKPPLHIPTQAKEIYDVTGAGDTIISILATCISAGTPLEESCFLANVGASIVISKLGTSTISLLELKNSILNRKEKDLGIISQDKLKYYVSNARQHGEKIVMTNGIFDILHVGHVSYLTNARKLGDRLIVAVNSDASTKRLKGQERPVNVLEQRMIMLAALKSVDWVISFEEDTPQRIISEILPDLLVKGGDYSQKDIVGGKEVIAAGGEVRILNFESNFSTTNIIQTIYKNNTQHLKNKDKTK